MQAVRVHSQPDGRLRWSVHILIVGAVALLVWNVLPESPPTLQSAGRAPLSYPGVPASPAQTWAPIRIPIRSRPLRDPSPPAAVARPLDNPEGQGEQTAGTDVDPGLLVSTDDLTIWSSATPDARAVARVPRLAFLESAGPAQNGRIPVRLGSSEQVEQIRAWVDATVVAAAGPISFTMSRPWDAPFAFGEDQLRLKVPYRTQLDGSPAAGSNCGPASLGMILESFGMYVPTDTLRTWAHRFQGTAGPETGFLLEALQKVAETYGLEGQDLLEGRRYRRWTLEDVRQHLRAGHPVIPQLRYRLMPGREWAGVNYDHYLVLTGVDGEDFIFNDPIPWSGRGQGRISAMQLLRAWQNSDAPMAALAIAGRR